MMLPFQKRKQQVIELLTQAYDQKTQIERYLLTTFHPSERARLLHEEEELNQTIAQWETELEKLSKLGETDINPIQNQTNQKIIVEDNLASAETKTKHLHNLPAELNSFIGREREITAVKKLLEISRLVTLVGAGGTGKTRLSIQVAYGVLEQFLDGVWLVELASVTDPAIVPQTIATALDIREEPNQPMLTTLINYLKYKQLLIVLDNCEHLITACAQSAEKLLQYCPKVQLLASSREPLSIGGEMAWRVPSLSSPNPKSLPSIESLTQYEAVQLFISRSVAVQPNFQVTNANAPAVAQICHRLDGIPLAIELAAARVKMLRVEQIAMRLDDRFHLLSGGSRTALPRQQTLRAMIDWSYDLLTIQEKQILRRLSVFVGDWSLEASEAVCICDNIADFEILDLMLRLLDKSLIVMEEQVSQLRYRMLDTIRQYAYEKLNGAGETEQAQEAHFNFFLNLAEEAAPDLEGFNQKISLNRIDAEYDNIREALKWALQSNVPTRTKNGLRLVEALWRYWQLRGYYREGREWAEIALARSSNATPLEQAKVAYQSGFMYFHQGDYVRASELCKKSLALSRELDYKQGILWSLHGLGCVERDQHDYIQAQKRFEEVLLLSQELDDKPFTVSGLVTLAQVVAALGDYSQGLQLCEQALALSQSIGDIGRSASTLIVMGQTLCSLFDYNRSKACFEQSLLLYRELGSKAEIAFALKELASIYHSQGNFEQARSLLEESLTLFQESGIKWGVVNSLLELGMLALDEGDTVISLQLFEDSLSLFQELGLKWGIGKTFLGLGLLSYLQGDYTRAEELLGQSLILCREVEDKNGIVRSLNILGMTAFCKGNYSQAMELCRESMVLRMQQGDKVGIAECLESLARIEASIRNLEWASKLWGAAEAIRDSIKLPLSGIFSTEYTQAVDDVYTQLGAELFTKNWSDGRNTPLDQLLIYYTNAQS
jgi:predicted ATPase